MPRGQSDGSKRTQFQPGVQSWRRRHTRNTPRTREADNAYDRAYRAERRARGLCTICAEISIRFANCPKCRRRIQANRKRREEERRAHATLQVLASPSIQPDMASADAAGALSGVSATGRIPSAA